MRYLESFEIGLKGLQANKLRTFLTMLGIIFGVGAVIAMMSIGEGARQETLQQIELMGTNNIIINKVSLKLKGEKGKSSFSSGLTLNDSKAIKELNPLVEYITPVREMMATITYKSTIFQAKIIGTTPDFPATFNSKVVEGAFVKSFNIDGYSNVCVIGHGIKERLFKFEDPLMKKIKIGELWFDVIGVIADKNIASGASGFGMRNFNDDIYIPLSTMMYKVTKPASSEGEVTGMIFFFGGDEETAKVVDRTTVDQLTVKVKDSNVLKEAAALTRADFGPQALRRKRLRDCSSGAAA